MELTDNDAIIAYILGEQHKLSKPQEAKLERVFFCDDLIRQYGIRSTVLKFMVSKFKTKYGEMGKTYSRRTAINDYHATQVIFGSTSKEDRDYHVSLLLQQIQETRHIAKITKTATALARCDANHAAAIAKFMGDKDTPDYSQMNVPDPIFIYDPSLLGVKLPDDKKLQLELAKMVDDTTTRQEASDIYTSAEEVRDDE